MTVLSQHGCFGEALDALFDVDALDVAVRHVDGKWCVVRDSEALASFEREQATSDQGTIGSDFSW